MNRISIRTVWARPARSLAALFALAFGPAAPSAPAQDADEPIQLPTVNVKAGSASSAPRRSAMDLAGTQLLLRQGGGNTLGSALSGLPGLSSTWYGPNADRPIVRGLDGNRVDILSNGSSLVDASATSYDHNAPLNPLAAQRIELLRGPQALPYSGGAVGGVIDVTNGDIPYDPVQGVSGVAQWRGDSAFHGGAAAFTLDGGNGKAALHAEAHQRRAGDYSVPGGVSAPSIANGRVTNSAARAGGGSLGGSLTGDWGYAGLSASRSEDLYGSILDPAVRIDMRQSRTSLRGELRNLPVIGSLGLQYTHSDYQHAELDAGMLATRFVNQGDNLRLVARRRAGAFDAEVGMQLLQSEFSALGLEAFLPRTRTRDAALFALLGRTAGRWSWSTGARLERAEVAASGEADTGVARFGSASSRGFVPASASLQGQYAIDPLLSVSGTVSHNERAPRFDELYANGPHEATGAYERGNPNLPKERSNSLEIGLKYGQGRTRYGAALYTSHYSNYVALIRSGRDVDGDGNPLPAGAPGALPEFQYLGVKARFAGIEASMLQPLPIDAPRVDFAARLDWVRADDLSHGQPLPRIAPLRFAPALIVTQGPWTARVELQMAARQNHVPASDPLGPTPGYALLGASFTRRFGSGGLDGLWFVKLTNLTDQAAYNASSVDTLRKLAPLPGRGLSVGLLLGL